MIILWVIAVILCLIGILCLLSIHVSVQWQDSALTTVKAGLGPFSVDLLRLLKKPKKKKPEKKQDPVSEKDARRGRSRFPRLCREDIRLAVRLLLPALQRTLQRLRQRLRISPLQCAIFLGGQNDPAQAAENYGYLQALIWTGMPVLEQLVHISGIRLHTEIDFQSSRTRTEGEVGISARIGSLLAVGICMVTPVVQWLRLVQKAHQKPQPEEEREKKAPDARQSAA